MVAGRGGQPRTGECRGAGLGVGRAAEDARDPAWRRGGRAGRSGLDGDARRPVSPAADRRSGGYRRQAARRTLRAGQPLYANDLRAPIIVAKGSNVTMSYRTSSMVLTTIGKALKDGGQGETIRVLNTQTNTVIDAMVEGSGMVVVTSRRRLALN